MTDIVRSPPTATRGATGWRDGLIGVLIFSGSMPATRVAVLGLDPFFVTFARAAIAGALAIVALRIGKAAWPQRRDLTSLVIVAVTVVIGFPLLSGLALRQMTSARSIVFLGLLPLSTAIFAVVLAGERPRPAFWPFALVGAALVAGYALSGGQAGSRGGDALMMGAVLVCGLGYAEGGRLSRRLGGWQVICWALVLALPVMAPLAIWTAPASWPQAGWPAALGLAYVSVFSMLLGFVFWYRGLARGGIAAVGQLQLAQPFFALILAALLLHEPVRPAMLGVLAGVGGCVAGARRFGVAGGQKGRRAPA